MFKKMKAFSQRIRAFPQRKAPKSVGRPEVDLLDPKESRVPDPRAPEPEPETVLVDTEQFCIPETDLVAPPEPKLDVVDPKESRVPEPRAPEPEPETDLVAPPEMHLFAPPEPKLDVVDPKESYVSPKGEEMQIQMSS